VFSPKAYQTVTSPGQTKNCRVPAEKTSKENIKKLFFYFPIKCLSIKISLAQGLKVLVFNSDEIIDQLRNYPL
jgi:hypothetical protein